MRGVRIRWRGLAKVAAAACVGLIVINLLPGMLRAPEPPPLGADVGLPKPVAVEKPASRRRKPKRSPRSSPVPDEPASIAKIGTRTRHVRRHPAPSPAVRKPAARRREPRPETAPEYVQPPAPEPPAEPVYEPPPAAPPTPGDGSQEFAPR